MTHERRRRKVCGRPWLTTHAARAPQSSLSMLSDRSPVQRAPLRPVAPFAPVLCVCLCRTRPDFVAWAGCAGSACKQQLKTACAQLSTRCHPLPHAAVATVHPTCSVHGRSARAVLPAFTRPALPSAGIQLEPLPSDGHASQRGPNGVGGTAPAGERRRRRRRRLCIKRALWLRPGAAVRPGHHAGPAASVPLLHHLPGAPRNPCRAPAALCCRSLADPVTAPGGCLSQADTAAATSRKTIRKAGALGLSRSLNHYASDVAVGAASHRLSGARRMLTGLPMWHRWRAAPGR